MKQFEYFLPSRQRDTDALRLEDSYRRLNYQDEDTGKIPAIGGFLQKTTYEIKGGQNALEALFSAANNHSDKRTDHKVPRKIQLNESYYRMFRAYMIARRLDPNDGFTYTQQGFCQPCQIAVECDPSIKRKVAVCIS